MHFLEAQPMAALRLNLRRELPNLPLEHVFLHGGYYALSFIDVTPHWKGLIGKAELSFISSNYSPLNVVSKGGAKNLLLKETGEYLPITFCKCSFVECNFELDVDCLSYVTLKWLKF